MTQREQVLNHLKSGRYLTKLEAMTKLGCGNLASVISHLRARGHPIQNEDRRAKRSGRFYVAYYLPRDGHQPEAPSLFPEDMVPENVSLTSEEAVKVATAQVFDTLDESDTALRQGSPPSVGGTEVQQVQEDMVAPVETVAEPVVVEIRDHHVGNPDDPAQILEAFREYCEQYGGKKVPITSDWARQLLRLNRLLPPDVDGDLRNNRTIAAKKLAVYKTAFLDGKFYYTNIGIGFDSDGMLADGQTRLTACRDTGVTFYANVDFDLPPETFAVVDSKMSSRSNGDIATMTGVGVYPQMHAAAVSHLYRRDQGLNHTTSMNALQMVEALRAYDVKASVAVAKKTAIPGPKSVFAAVHYLAAKIDRRLADQMFEELRTGAGLAADDPVLVARNRLLRSYSSQSNEFRGAGDKRARVMLSRAFNYRRTGVKVSKYLLDGGDDWPDAGSVVAASNEGG